MFCFVSVSQPPLSGGYCVGVPPLPIPNREVKPTYADGTAMQCGRVGSRLFYMEPPESWCFPEAFFYCVLSRFLGGGFLGGYNKEAIGRDREMLCLMV